MREMGNAGPNAMTNVASLTPDLIDCFRRDGFVVVPDLLKESELARFGAAVDAGVVRRTRRDTRQLAEKSRYEQSFIQCQNLWEDCPDVRLLTFHSGVTRTAASLLGVDAIRIWHDQALYKEPGGRETSTPIRTSPTGRSPRPTPSPPGSPSTGRRCRAGPWAICRGAISWASASSSIFLSGRRRTLFQWTA